MIKEDLDTILLQIHSRLTFIEDQLAILSASVDRVGTLGVHKEPKEVSTTPLKPFKDYLKEC